MVTFDFHHIVSIFLILKSGLSLVHQVQAVLRAFDTKSIPIAHAI